MESHENKISKMQLRLKTNLKGEKEEIKVHAKIINLVEKYKAQCFPRKERKRFSKDTPLKVLRDEYMKYKLK